MRDACSGWQAQALTDEKSGKCKCRSASDASYETYFSVTPFVLVGGSAAAPVSDPAAAVFLFQGHSSTRPLGQQRQQPSWY
jgi:hypothetical protein